MRPSGGSCDPGKGEARQGIGRLVEGEARQSENPVHFVLIITHIITHLHEVMQQ